MIIPADLMLELGDYNEMEGLGRLDKCLSCLLLWNFLTNFGSETKQSMQVAVRGRGALVLLHYLY